MDEFAVYSAGLRIESWLRDEPELFSEVKDKVVALQNDLKMMLNLLGNQTSRTPVEAAEVRQIVNDVEDVTDSFVYNIRSVDHNMGLAKIGGSLFNIQRAHLLGIKIEAVQKRVQDVVGKLEIHIGNVSDVEHHSTVSYVGWGEPVDEEDEYVVGLEGDIHNMVQQLTANEGNDQASLFFIVGCPSTGKTTLARKLYNNTTLRKHFQKFIWYDRPEYHFRHFRRTIFEQATTKSFSYDRRKTWVDDIGKCLIFIDDITISMTETLGELLGEFPSGMNESRIVITCSNEEAVPFKKNPSCYFHHVKGDLNEALGWDLLCHLTQPKQELNTGYNPRVEKSGKAMLERCEGQLTAIMLLSGLLRSKKSSIEEWEKVQQGLTNKSADGVKDVFELSYVDLPYYLKACFLYLGVFPPKYQIKAGVFRRMWIAEGFEPNYSEHAVMRCLEELFRRHLIQVLRRSGEGRIKVIQLQTRVHEFCITKAREEMFVDIHPNDFGVSHSRWCSKRPGSYLKSFFQFQGTTYRIMRLDCFYMDFKLVRVLSLWGIRTSDDSIPEEIGNLVYLRYLAMRHTNIKKLPKSFGNLKKLLTLDWRNVYIRHVVGSLDAPYDVFCKMEQLRHLYIPHNALVEHHFALHNLNSLHTLWRVWVEDFPIDNISWWNDSKLENLYLVSFWSTWVLRESFGWSNKLPNLRRLKLEWWNTKSSNDFQSMEPLYQHFRQLTQLILCGPMEENVELQFPPNLIVLKLKRSNIIGQDPMLAIGNCCPKLKYLEIKDEGYCGTEMTCRVGAFKVLVELVIDKMYNLERWVIETGALPCLKNLVVTDCHKLVRIPVLKELHIGNDVQKLL